MEDRPMPHTTQEVEQAKDFAGMRADLHHIRERIDQMVEDHAHRWREHMQHDDKQHETILAESRGQISDLKKKCDLLESEWNQEKGAKRAKDRILTGITAFVSAGMLAFIAWGVHTTSAVSTLSRDSTTATETMREIRADVKDIQRRLPPQ